MYPAATCAAVTAVPGAFEAAAPSPASGDPSTLPRATFASTRP